MKAARGILLLTFVAGVAVGGSIAQDAHRHPYLASAQQLVHEAYDKITTAQKDNHYDMQGHATRAKELLQQAESEISQAATAADQHHK